MTAKPSFSIAELAAAGGVSRRTVHFYVQRRLLSPPDGLGRGARYSDRHLARLLQIKAWQEQGVPLVEIRGRLSGDREREVSGVRPDGGGPSHRGIRLRPDSAPAASRVSAPLHDTPGTAWFRQPLAPGFELHVAAGARPLDAHQLAALAHALGDILKSQGEEE